MQNRYTELTLSCMPCYVHCIYILANPVVEHSQNDGNCGNNDENDDKDDGNDN